MFYSAQRIERIVHLYDNNVNNWLITYWSITHPNVWQLMPRGTEWKQYHSTLSHAQYEDNYDQVN